ncbi:MAG TPA: DNA gyrase subunit A, partial [Gammaproteobacteria bacterium]|nr:DNA gyrase subunit A [Gammaproteobacteria bacterium]
GMRVVIEVRKNDNAEVLLNNLYTLTSMQNVFGINLVALEDGQPKLFTLKRLIQAFIAHRREVVTRRTIYDLRKARERAHILEGLAVALTNIDPIITLIKQSKNPQEAKEKLLTQIWQPSSFIPYADYIRDLGAEYTDAGYRLSEAQAQAILELRLHRLTGLEQDRILAEYQELQALIQVLKEILQNPDTLMRVIREELLEVKGEFGDARRTEILSSQQDLDTEDLIPEENVVVTLSQQGYVKYQPLDVYQAQRRGGRGKSAASVKEEDAVDQLLVASTHDTILCFSSQGKLYWLKVYQLPQAGRSSRGRPIINLLPLSENEKINTLLPVREFDAEHFVVMVTSSGVIKKTALSEFSRPRASGIIAVDLIGDDKLVQAAITKGSDDILL